jgi:transketolase C-terminal domain/subunit
VYTHIWSQKSSNLRSVRPLPLGYQPLMDRNEFRHELAQQLRVDSGQVERGHGLRAPDQLEADGLQARVIDLYSVKPVDAGTLAAAATETGAIVTVEDHWREGGLGDAVLDGLASAGELCPVRKLAVDAMPGSGSPEELIHEAGIDAEAIATAVKEIQHEQQVA